MGAVQNTEPLTCTRAYGPQQTKTFWKPIARVVSSFN